MRLFLIGALAALAFAAPAAAQSSRDFAGTWAFRTDYYGEASLSGAAIIRPSRRNGAFNISLVAQEQSHTGGDITTAPQICTGVATGAQLSITCQLTEATPNYAPDNFELTLTGPGSMEGVLQSASQAQTLFVRVR